VVFFSSPVAGSYRVRILQVTPTERPMASAVCSRLKPGANGSTIAYAARSSAAVLAFFNRSIATSSCSTPLAFHAMIASTEDKDYIITVSICNWNNTLTTDFCIEAVQEAINKHGKPDIFNTDQGCQFTSLEFTGLLKDNGIQISMDGKGSWRDNVFVERLWKSVKSEEVYLHAYDSVCDAKQGLEKYFMFYNQNRPHTVLDDKTPNELYFDNLPAMQKAG
jgi:hypothetical protein